MSDVNGRYEKLGEDLKEHLNRQQASLELRQKAREDTEELKSWLSDREQSLKQGQTASPSRPEVVRAQAQENKVKSRVCLSRWLNDTTKLNHMCPLKTTAKLLPQSICAPLCCLPAGSAFRTGSTLRQSGGAEEHTEEAACRQS